MQSFPLKEFAVLQNICSVSILVGPGLYIVMLYLYKNKIIYEEVF